MKTMRKTALFFMALILIIPACDPPGENKYDPKSDSYKAYNVIYDANGADSGEVPVDDTDYVQGQTVVVLGNTGNLTIKTQDGISLSFTGWNTADNGSGVDYDATGSDFFIMGKADVTLYAKWSALRSTGPGGGLVFYDKGSYSNGWRYLEAAPSDQSTGAEWGCNGTALTGADGTAVGTGYQNTIDIEAGCTTAGTAADICANLTIGIYNNWFLPSKDELNLMYTNLKAYGVGGFAVGYYWSSSEVLTSHAWIQLFNDFSGGYQTDNGKGNPFYVRAIRAF